MTTLPEEAPANIEELLTVLQGLPGQNAFIVQITEWLTSIKNDPNSVVGLPLEPQAPM